MRRSLDRSATGNRRKCVASERRQARIKGVVQGVGFRPFVYRLATSLGLAGWVQNGAAGVLLEVEGPADRLERFFARLRTEAPPAAGIEATSVTAVAPRGETAFTIRPSDRNEPVEPTLPPDLATCEECLAEVRDGAARRHAYPFTNCTRCGPRYSILERLPYDRPHTTMKSFAMCADCAAEYRTPGDRRFHAQPIACPRCGPRLTLADGGGRPQVSGPDALAAAVRAVEAGEIVALKGLGGFQLLVDATDSAAVLRLRARKRRPAKPFAVLFPSLERARTHLELSAAEAAALASPEAPILLVLKRGDGGVAAAVAPDNPRLGVMLPYTPLHALLADALDRPLVCTSGNLSGEPMCIDDAEVIERLGGVVDRILTHDRPIVRPVDDSVARVDGADVVLLRRARGHAPRTIRLPVALPRVLAVGGHLKAAIALGLGDRVLLSQHLGDLDGPEGLEVFDRSVADLMAFLDFKPEAVASDLHPDYASTRRAHELAARYGVPHIAIQHHHAHVAAAAAEHGLTRPLLGLAWDGTGYGPDGTIWGGEALAVEGGRVERVSHLLPFPLPGGERAVEEPRRSALGLLSVLDPDRAAHEAGRWFAPAERDVLLRMIARGVNAPLTSSMGRLFDAVAALLGLGARCSFESEAAMALEFAAEHAAEDGAYPLPLGPDRPAVADWRPLAAAVLADRDRGVAPARIAARFHNALADHAVAVARSAGLEDVALTGGCFQNRTLALGARARLEAAGFRVYTHCRVPTNDGGLALGQVWAAGHRLA
ncbi:MAG: carbamoyltransferase HypF [Planctomycetes bacterium]|nr:carbamoyltransferase HypF [Planctomycetota bacterium]